MTASACTTVPRNHVVKLPQSPSRPTAEVVCLVDVDPSLLPVYARTTKGESCFYVRINNTTRMLEGPHVPNYIDGHWK